MTTDSNAVRNALAALPRADLSLLPTPLHRLPGLSRSAGAEIWTKRDDLTGLAFGGNKVRELDFIVGRALADGADLLIAGGGVAQSNHARQCAAAARAVGIDIQLVLRRGVRENVQQGNRLITDILGGAVHWVDDDPAVSNRTSTEPAMRALESSALRSGRRPYVLASSFHPLAAAAYVECALELAEQIAATGLAGQPLEVWVTSMGATHAGLALGIAWLDLPWQLSAVSWRPVPGGLDTALCELAERTAAILGLDNPLDAGSFVTRDHGGPAYGVPSAEAWSAIAHCARSDGFLLDPVYTAKGMAGLLASLARRDTEPVTPVVFVHTGGLPALFAYGPDAASALNLPDPG